MASASLLGVSVVPAVTIDVYFVAYSPLYWEKRLAAWRGNWEISEIEVEIDDLPVRVYTSVSYWLGELLTCRISGECPDGYSACAQRTGYGRPSA